MPLSIVGFKGSFTIASLTESIRQSHLFPAQARVVVGVSGGPDSLALLHALNSLRAALTISLHVASLDHGLRPEAAADVRFVQSLAQAWGLPFSTERVDVAALAVASGCGVETAARDARYAFLARVAHQAGAGYVAVAHHAGDQAESVLMHLLRGAGLQGLQGMRPLSPLPGAPDLMLVRPLLRHSRQEILAYCDQHNLRPRQDPTNADTRVLRNYIRHRVLPALRIVNPQAERSLTRLADNVAHDQDFLERCYRRDVLPHVTDSDERISLSRARFAALHPAMQRRWLLHSAAQLGGLPTMERIEQALLTGERGQVGQVVELPGRVRLRVDYEVLIVEKASAGPLLPGLWLPTGFEQALTVPGAARVEAAGWGLRLEWGTSAAGAISLDLPAGAHISLRGRRPGDRFRPPGLGGRSQKLSDWMINNRLPRDHRDGLPLLVIDGEIAAVGLADGWIIASPFVVKAESTRVVNVITEIYA